MFSKDHHTFRRVRTSYQHVVQQIHDSSSSHSSGKLSTSKFTFSCCSGHVGELSGVLIWPTDVPGRQGWKMGFLCCIALCQAHLYPPLGNEISGEHVLWGFFAFLRLEPGAQLEVC